MNLFVNEPLQTRDIVTIVLCSILAILLVMIVTIIIYRSIKKRKIRKSEEKVNQKIEDSTSGLILALGGKENIKEVSVMGSRVRVLLNDYEKIHREEILKLHDSVLFMNDKVTFVVGSLSNEFASKLNNRLHN